MSKVYYVLLLLLVTGCTAVEPETAQQQALPASPAKVSNPGAPQTDNRPVILAFGDSLTAGYGLSRAQGYPEQLQQALDDMGYKYRVVNAGVSGDTSSNGRARMQIALRDKPSIVILELGANDGLRGLPTNQMQGNLAEMIVGFKKAGAKVVLAGMSLPLNYGIDYVRSFEKVFVDLADEHDTAFIPFFLEGVAADFNLNLGDGMHPNEKGYGVVVQNLLKYLEPLLEKS